MFESITYTNNNLFTLLNNFSEQACSKFSSATKIFYEQSLFFSMNNQAIEEKFNQYKDLSWVQKFKLGVVEGCKGLFVAISVTRIL